LSSRVTAAIEALLVEHGMQPGDRLPSERQLADQFGVSRTVVREAVRSLHARGLLDVRPGFGTTVRRPSASSVSQSINLFWGVGRQDPGFEKVLEVRRMLEVEVAKLAAERRTPEDLDVMEEILRRASPAQRDVERFAKDDVAFHAALARATHNELHVVLMESISDLMLEVRRKGFEVPDTPARAIAYHQRIFNWVAVGDAENAQQAMREHLMEAKETQQRAWLLNDSATTGRDGRRKTEQIEEVSSSERPP
jgi:GntR family transcriptional repressor for pyruvate dehydrogenase complex